MVKKEDTALIPTNRFEGINYAAFETDLARYKLMPGGAPMLERVDPHGGDSKYVPSIDGVIVGAQRTNLFFDSDFDGGSTSPTCSSQDGIHGEGDPGGLCADCPLNQYGSGRSGKSKACKNKVKLFIQIPGEELPSVLVLPATSIASYDKYVDAVESTATDVSEVITRIKLEKAKNSGGIAYSRTVFEGLGIVSAADLDRLLENYKSIIPSSASTNHQTAVDQDQMIAHLDRIVSIF